MSVQPPPQQQQQQPRKKQRKSSSPDALLTAEVRQAAKHNDPLAGLAAYDKAKAEGKPPAIIDCEDLLTTSHIWTEERMGTYPALQPWQRQGLMTSMH